MSAAFGPRKTTKIEPIADKDQKTKPKTSSVFDYAQRKKEKDQEEEFENQEESKLEWLLRNASRTGTDISQVVVGAPGDLLSLSNELAKPISKATTGEKPSEYHELPISKVLPTSGMLEAGNPDYLKPRTEGEVAFSEFTRDITSLLLPTPAGKGKIVNKGLKWLEDFSKRLFKSMGLAGTGQAAKESAEKLGVEPETAQKIKMATVFLGSVGTESGFKGAEKYKNSLYKEMRQARPSGAQINATNVLRKARQLKVKLEKGGKSPSSTAALAKTEELIDKIQKGRGKISVEELEQFGTKTNELKASLYDEFKSNKVGRKAAKSNLNAFTEVIEGGLDQYGNTNPRYMKARNSAKEVHGAIESSKATSKFLKRNIKGLTSGGIGTIAIEAITHPGAIIPTTTGALGAFSGLKGAELVARFVKSPKLRKYYLNVLDGAAREDAAFMNKNFQHMMKIIEDDPSLLEMED